MGLVPFTYTRPAHVSKEDFRQSLSSLIEKSSLRSGKSGVSAGVPNALSFDKIVGGQTCPPLSLHDFMNYLLYVEHAAENLQFYLWHQDYVGRFQKAPAADLALAPEWTRAMEDDVLVRLQKEAAEMSRQQAADGPEMFRGTAFQKTQGEPAGEKAVPDAGNPFATPVTSSDGEPLSPFANTHRSLANDAFAAAGVKVPFTIQPYREEISRVITTYIMDGAPRQLNLSDRDRRALMTAFSYTTHPSALRIAFQAVDASLRFQNHPNFVRWSICNGNPPRISFARTLGLAGVVGAFVVAVLLTLSHAHAAWRALAAIGWVAGIWAVVASYRGMCICMHLFSRHHHHVRPWDLFADVEGGGGGGGGGKESFESLASSSSNSFEDEPWVAKYSQRNLARKIFDKEAWIQEPVLRQIHDTIFLQSMLVGLLSGAVLTAVFVPSPAGNFL